MTAATRWVIGRGLLGRAIERARRGAVLVHPIPWDDPDGSVRAIREGLQRLAAFEGPLEIYWTAGRGVTSTPATQLDVEVAVFEAALAAVAEQPASVRSRLGFFLASSVGGAYAGAEQPPFTEATVPVPLSAYGEAKLRMEAALETATTAGGWRSFIARITNIYGAGQNLTKAQGLISALVRGHLSGQPISVYVPLDTLRDYIYEDDCAAVIDAGMVRTRMVPAGTTTSKIVGSMRAISIGAILSELTRLRRRRGSIVLGGGDARGQALDLRVRSTVWTDLDGLVRTSLPEGLSRVYQAQLTGRLDPS
jgi:UDP-glucose 4-epimerase